MISRAFPLICLAILGVQGFEEGCPAWQCVSGFPYHGSEAQSSTPPATISLSQANYSPGDTITVTLSGSSTFEGFVIRAFRAPGGAGNRDLEELVGGFTNLASTHRGLAWFPSAGFSVNCVTHADEDDFNSLTFTWTAPSTSVGNVIFRATVLEDYEVFWVNVQSPVLTANTAAPTSTFNSVVKPDFSNFGFDKECGKTKGCLRYPGGCKGDKCSSIVAYQAINGQSQIRIEMMVKRTDGYGSVGFSADRHMGDELTVTCLRNGDGLFVQHGSDLTEEGLLYNGRQRITDLTDIHIASQNGNLYCSFVRSTSLSYTDAKIGQTRTSDLKSTYLFIANGGLYTGTEVIRKHDELPVVSTSKVNLLQTNVVTGTSTPVLVGVHAFFGLIGYLVMLGFPMLLARHFRKEISKPLCGIGAWFQLHRGFTIALVCCGGIAIILVLVSIGGWNRAAITTCHGVFGILATAFMLANIIMGTKRPGNDDPNRKKFNLAHRICGVLAYVFTVICLLLGSNAEALVKDLKVKVTILIAVGFGIQILIEVILEIIQCRKSQATANYEMEGKADDSNAAAEPGAKPSSKMLKLVFLGVYGVAMLVIAIAAIFFMFSF